MAVFDLTLAGFFTQVIFVCCEPILFFIGIYLLIPIYLANGSVRLSANSFLRISGSFLEFGFPSP